MKAAKKKKAMQLARRSKILRPRDMEARGLSRRHVSRLVDEGFLRRVGRGVYVVAGSEPTENRTLAEVCKRVPKGVICLLSALRFHGLTTQMPAEVWLAVDAKAWRPKEPELPIRIVHFSGRALTSGIKRHRIEGVSVKVYSVAKTVADCFKSRNKIGLDVAIEALRDCRRRKLCTNDDLWRFAKVCRVATVMKPYLVTVG